MKPKLLILSDMFGFDNSSWASHYTKLLEPEFELILYDICKLAGINRQVFAENKLHSQFINGGINSAVKELMKLEREEVYVIGFSVGGTIAWKAALKGLKIRKIYAVSSTRLRYETKRPNCFVETIFGEKDLFKPSDSWFEELNIKAKIIKNGEHEIYKSEDVITKLCNGIKNSK